jgi:hypothetical protein
MSSVWRRPWLTGLELLWRWIIGIPTLGVFSWEALRISHVVTIDSAALQSMTVFKPVQAGATLSTTVRDLTPVVLPVLLWLVPLALLFRITAASFGRAALLRKLDAREQPKRGVLFVLSALRTGALLIALALWLWGARWANSFTITGPASAGQEPNLVLFCAVVVFGTLALFVAWASSMWILDAAIVAEHEGGVFASIRAALRSRGLRSKLVEINLVMGIVKIGLIVLAMVFSSCPLPFESVESQTFLACWWAGVIVLYFVASDYFHVVRMAAYLALYRVYEVRVAGAPEIETVH